MAKSPKKRTKKGTGDDFKRREIDAIVNNAYQRVKFLGDTWYTPRACGIQKLWTHLRGPYHDIGLSCFLKHLSREMEWSMNLTCFFTCEGEENTVHSIQTFALLKNVELKEVSKELSNVVIASINQCLNYDEKFNENNMCYYAYCLYPEFSEHYNNIGDGLSDLMVNLSDITTFKHFNGVLPGHISNENTLFQSLKDNGIFPKVKDPLFIPTEEFIVSDTDDFLISDEVFPPVVQHMTL